MNGFTIKQTQQSFVQPQTVERPEEDGEERPPVAADAHQCGTNTVTAVVTGSSEGMAIRTTYTANADNF